MIHSTHMHTHIQREREREAGKPKNYTFCHCTVKSISLTSTSVSKTHVLHFNYISCVYGMYKWNFNATNIVIWTDFVCTVQLVCCFEYNMEEPNWNNAGNIVACPLILSKGPIKINLQRKYATAVYSKGRRKNGVIFVTLSVYNCKI